MTATTDPKMGSVRMRWRAPVMSYGGMRVNAIYPTYVHPTTSMIVGLLGNALGITHAQGAWLDALTQRLVWSARLLRQGVGMRDFHTVDLGQPHMASAMAWHTSTHEVSARGGQNAKNKHITHKDYIVDGELELAISLGDPDVEEDVTRELELGQLVEAIAHPARPLYLGRKSCLPSAPMNPVLEPHVHPRALVEQAARTGELAWYRGPRPPKEVDLTPIMTTLRCYAHEVHQGQDVVWQLQPQAPHP